MSEPEFPRYFRHCYGFQDGTWLVRWADVNHYACVDHDGTEGDLMGCLHNSFPRHVAIGAWTEIPRREAEAMIRKARGEE